jgi:hypothetical protein
MFNIRSEYSVGGQRTFRDGFMRGIAKEARKLAVDEISTNVSRVRCPVHGQYARVASVNGAGDRLTFRISGCCDGVIERATGALR